MTIEKSQRGIGSFFETLLVAGPPRSQAIPWETAGDLTYVQTGRQALALVADAYSNEGRSLILAPQYLCESMLLGFDEDSWDLNTYRLHDDLTVDVEDLVSKVSRPEDTVILDASYFGNEPSDEHVDAIRMLRRTGVRVIEDETHRLFGPLEPLGDVGIASLRKLLPVADGAYIRGQFNYNFPSTREHTVWEAMDAKATGNIALANDLYDKGTAELESRIRHPAGPSSRTLSTLSQLDFDDLRSQRQQNANALREYLRDIDGVKILNEAEIPSHLVISVSDAKSLQKGLAGEGIYCPIHWPQPERVSFLDWRHDLLSLPVDHRYGIREMREIAEKIRMVMK